jgi:molecular chaperone GrpE
MTRDDSQDQQNGNGDLGDEVPVEVAPPPELAPPVEDPVAVLEREKKELHDRLLRTAADLENFRKRSRKELDDARVRAREEILREILPSVDNLERALTAAQEPNATVTVIVDGVKLVLRQFLSGLERFEIKPFSSLGEAFDPTRHEAVSQIETDAQPAGSVVSELQRGYLIGNRLLRPAMVAVAKAPPRPEAADAESAE